MPKTNKNTRRVAVKQSAGTAKTNNQQGGNGGMAKKLDQLLSRIPRGTFATVGGALGGPTGAMIGKGISTITGYGDYNVKTNTLMNRTVVGEMADQVPVFKQQGADTRLKHCEYVTDVVVPLNPQGFNVVPYEIDPTNVITFPWLSSVAKKYQRYKVKGMVIGFRSTSTDYQNSGVVAIAVNYDPAEAAYESMEGLLNTKFAVSTKPSNSMLAPVECDPSRSPMDGYYVKHVTSTDVNDATKRQTIMGTINVATSGLTLTPGTTLGQLYISYDIELIYPYLHKLTQQSLAAYGNLYAFVDWQNETAFNFSIAQQATGVISNYGALNPDEKVLIRRFGKPTEALPSGATAWVGFVLPVGKWLIKYLEGSWVTTTSTLNKGASNSQPSYGSKVTKLVEDYEDVSAQSRSSYTVSVADGTAEERTMFPASQIVRTVTGTSPATYITMAVTAIKLD